jgi:hypothetical protein
MSLKFCLHFVRKDISGTLQRLMMLLVFLPFALTATEPDSPDDVIFVNTGMMNVHTGGENGVALYVPFAFRSTSANASIQINGQMNLGGNFYQNATSPAFRVDPATSFATGFSDGIVRFTKNTGVDRLITSDNLTTTYDRGVSYIAFPNIRVATNDLILLPAKMGMDAKTLQKENSATGKLILKSDRIVDNVYDASLRISGTGSSSQLVDPGIVIVEREMSYYRSESAGQEKIFGFASPFSGTQLSGYFAGNWVRRPIANSETGHTQYIFGNQQDVGGTILANQYISNPQEALQSGQAYLIRPRPTGYDYRLLGNTNGLSITSGGGEVVGSSYNQAKFTFNGSVYSLTGYSEQLFAENHIFQKSVTSTTSTINWLIGNSYTAPISTKKLIDAMAASDLRFSPFIWVLPAGSTTYQQHSISGTGSAIIVQDLDEIPAMSIFMIRVLSGTNAGSFSVTRDMQRHAGVTHSVPLRAPQGAPRATSSRYVDQVVFRVSPADNNQMYDLAAIGIRTGAQPGSDAFDMSKVFNNSDVFQLYTLSSQNVRLSANGIPPGTTKLNMGFKPVSMEAGFEISAEHVETLSSEGLWLEDKKMKQIIDLKQQSLYSFSSSPEDLEDRFVVHFVSPWFTSLETQPATELLIYLRDNSLIVENLQQEDMNSEIRILDASGKLIKSLVVNQIPVIEERFSFEKGVYLLQIKGKRNKVIKFVNP